VGRSYAGILGLVAFAAAVARGVLHGAGTEATLGRASACLVAFMALGWVIGRLADWIVEESVKAQGTTDRRIAVKQGCGGETGRCVRSSAC
jgi:hypothetical protein